MSKNGQPVLLVTGASGHLGRRVLELLLEAKIAPETIVAATRTPEKLADFSAQGVIVRRADFDDPASLEAAFQGVDRLLLISTHLVGVTRLNQHLNAVKAAETVGVSHVLYTSLTNPDPSSPITLAPDHWGTEQALSASAMGWTILRNNIYADGLANTLAQAVQLGGLFNAVGDGRIAYVAREDCARAAAAALASDFSGRRVLDITGAEAVGQAELAQIASEMSGKQIPYVPLTLEVLTQNLVSAGLPQPIAELIASFDAAAAQGRCAIVTNTVEELTGRKPISVAELIANQREALPAAH